MKSDSMRRITRLGCRAVATALSLEHTDIKMKCIRPSWRVESCLWTEKKKKKSPMVYRHANHHKSVNRETQTRNASLFFFHILKTNAFYKPINPLNAKGYQNRNHKSHKKNIKKIKTQINGASQMPMQRPSGWKQQEERDPAPVTYVRH